MGFSPPPPPWPFACAPATPLCIMVTSNFVLSSLNFIPHPPPSLQPHGASRHPQVSPRQLRAGFISLPHVHILLSPALCHIPMDNSDTEATQEHPQRDAALPYARFCPFSHLNSLWKAKRAETNQCCRPGVAFWGLLPRCHRTRDCFGAPKGATKPVSCRGHRVPLFHEGSGAGADSRSHSP